jgi:hypothetical protein
MKQIKNYAKDPVMREVLYCELICTVIFGIPAER